MSDWDELNIITSFLVLLNWISMTATLYLPSAITIVAITIINSNVAIVGIQLKSTTKLAQ